MVELYIQKIYTNTLTNCSRNVIVGFLFIQIYKGVEMALHITRKDLLDVQFECHSYAVNREFDSVGNSLCFVYRKGLPKGEQTKLTSVATYSNIDSALIYCL